jgi:hypothetical protein
MNAITGLPSPSANSSSAWVPLLPASAKITSAEATFNKLREFGPFGLSPGRWVKIGASGSVCPNQYRGPIQKVPAIAEARFRILVEDTMIAWA